MSAGFLGYLQKTNPNPLCILRSALIVCGVVIKDREGDGGTNCLKKHFYYFEGTET